MVVFTPQLAMCAAIILFTIRTPLGMLLWASTIALGLSLPRIGRRCFGAPSRENRTPFHHGLNGAGRFHAHSHADRFTPPNHFRDTESD